MRTAMNHHRTRMPHFGETPVLGLEEQQWLVGLFNEHIAHLQGIGEVDISSLPPPREPQKCVVNDSDW